MGYRIGSVVIPLAYTAIVGVWLNWVVQGLTQPRTTVLVDVASGEVLSRDAVPLMQDVRWSDELRNEQFAHVGVRGEVRLVRAVPARSSVLVRGLYISLIAAFLVWHFIRTRRGFLQWQDGRTRRKRNWFTAPDGRPRASIVIIRAGTDSSATPDPER